MTQLKSQPLFTPCNVLQCATCKKYRLSTQTNKLLTSGSFTRQQTMMMTCSSSLKI